jgi:hypothetical protein
VLEVVPELAAEDELAAEEVLLMAETPVGVVLATEQPASPRAVARAATERQVRRFFMARGPLKELESLGGGMLGRS